MDMRSFENITVDVPLERIYGRLGYANGKTAISAQQERLVAGYITQAKGLLSLKGAAARVRLLSWGQDKIILENKITFLSADL